MPPPRARNPRNDVGYALDDERTSRRQNVHDGRRRGIGGRRHLNEEGYEREPAVPRVQDPLRNPIAHDLVRISGGRIALEFRRRGLRIPR